ncbi:hypothetical protein [Streptomyces cinerochromogenes]|uniref:hypothetical protein n=1 Tax=Streptomyces cinerochromogenes TaxID=66422 RepID=UPI00166FA687|nr:hypothetical protein [Streptomyces cinerochromogenes]GGT02758.1 hypothetical protein GCM10010206_76740 [Streptomyces cinerochromogenes]
MGRARVAGLPAARDRLAQLVAERAELARAELASALGSAPSPEAEAKARALLERLGASSHGPRAAA